MCTCFNFAMRPKHLLCTEHSIDGGKWSANIWRLWGGENGEWQRPETAASVTSVSREMGRPRAFYQLTARSPAWRRHVTLVTCHVSILILQTLSTRLGNYWFVRHSHWYGYLVTHVTTRPLLSFHPCHILHIYSIPPRILAYIQNCRLWGTMPMKCCTFVTALSVFKMWPGEVLCCLLFQTFRFFWC